LDDTALPHRRTARISRRRAVGLGVAAASLSLDPQAMARGRRGMSQLSLFDDVRAYDALGEHRTASDGDVATTRWLERRLGEAGLTTELQRLTAPLFKPVQCRIELAGGAFAAFPAWPPVTTAPDGLEGVLAPAEAGDLARKIALVRIAYTPGASWAAAGSGEAVMAAIGKGASAVIAITEGPTGQIIALNTVPGRFQWTAPVVIAGGRNGAALNKAAVDGARVRLVSTGQSIPAAEAANVVGRRPGRGKTIVVSTPKSGWFHCAGERGSGLAVFLDLAPWLVRHSDADLLFVATSGHELGYGGGDVFVRSAPPPDQVRLWLHIGANVAVQDVTVADGVVTGTGRAVGARSLTATDDLAPAARQAFAGLSGYETPRALSAETAVGEVELFHKAGYDHLVGLVGAYALFHTPIDRAEIATTPAILQPLAAACRSLASAVA
jgi:hypothetical protein